MTLIQILIKRVEDLAKAIGDSLQLRGFKEGGTTGQIPVKNSGDPFDWSWQSVSGTGGASDVADLTTTGLTVNYMLRVKTGGGLEQRSPAQVRSDIGAASTAHSHAWSDITSGVPSSFPASDVYSWAKQATKPTYTYSEVGAQAPITDPSDIGAAALDSYGTLNLSSFSNSGAKRRSIILQGHATNNYAFLEMLRSTGAFGCRYYFWEDHSGGGEAILESSGRMAIITNEYRGLQLGLKTSLSQQYVYLQQRNPATSDAPYKNSVPLYFTTGYWHSGADTNCSEVGIEGRGTAAGYGELVVFGGATCTKPDDAATDGVRPEIAAFHKDGLRVTALTIGGQAAVVTNDSRLALASTAVQPATLSDYCLADDSRLSLASTAVQPAALTDTLTLDRSFTGSEQPQFIVKTNEGGNYVQQFPADGSYAITWRAASGTVAFLTDITKSAVGLGNVENTALSTWAGTTNITTIGTLSAFSLGNGATVTLTGTSQSAFQTALGGGTFGISLFGAASLSAATDLQKDFRKVASGDLSRNSTTNPATDSAFTVALEANSTYLVEWNMMFDFTTNCGFKLQCVAPSVLSTTLQQFYAGRSYLNAAGNVSITGTTITLGSYAAGTAGPRPNFGFFHLNTGSSAGDLLWQWAQSTSHADNCTRKGQSYVRVTKIG